MAGVVNEKYNWQPTINYGANPQQYARVSMWDSDSDTPVIDRLITDVNGQIAEAARFEAIHSITGTSTVATDTKTPHVVRVVALLTSAEGNFGTGIYGARIIDLPKTIAQASKDAYFLTPDPFITHDRTAIAAYTGLAINHGTETITVTANHTLTEIYEWIVYQAWLDPEKSPAFILDTSDNVNFDCEYNVTIDNCTVTADGQWLKLPAKTFTLQNGGQFSGKVTDSSGTQVTHVLTGIQQNSEVTYVDDADNPTITYHHIENVDVSGQSVYAYTHTIDFDVDILVFHVDYEEVLLEGVTLTDQGGSIPINQRTDLVYFNPT